MAQWETGGPSFHSSPPIPENLQLSDLADEVLPMPLFSSAFTEMAGRFSCHHTMPKQAGMSNSIKSTRLCQVGPGPV